MMIRFVLAATILNYVLTPITMSVDAPENFTSAPPSPSSLAPIYAKIIWPVDPANPVIAKDDAVIESWITKSIENQHRSKFSAVTAWVPLDQEPLETTDLWDGTLDGGHPACSVYADITERKDGWIKISFLGWTPFGGEATVTIKDEPGGREVVPVTDAPTNYGVPHVSVFIGLQVKRE